MASQNQGLSADCCPSYLDGDDMADFPKFEYTMHEVKRAGEALRGDIIWSEERKDDLLEIFNVANNWLDSHVRPMISLRREAVGKIRTLGIEGLTVSRLKRMRSIRKKLRRLSREPLNIATLVVCELH